jgi:hypothetical protein
MIRSLATRVATAIVVFVLGAAGPSCIRKGDVQVRITYEAGPADPSLERVTIFVGGSKSSWPTVAAREAVSVVLSPEDDAPQPMLNYTLRGTPSTWNGPAMRRGVGHAISIHIFPDGRIQEDHCETPCKNPARRH